MEGGREGGREREREGGREGGRERERERERERGMGRRKRWRNRKRERGVRKREYIKGICKIEEESEEREGGRVGEEYQKKRGIINFLSSCLDYPHISFLSIIRINTNWQFI